ncbi:hypothetical protein AYO41_04000 [Verrucomicrobia bacterium SCGC AG-212-E04]|nr:hypothetical protein AYO41_04000 [Verrucomicrobia bacterium SCGC AG-212-E04]
MSFRFILRLGAIVCFFFVLAGPVAGATVRLSNESPNARALPFAGIDYGAFRMVEVDEATADALVSAGLGEKVADANQILLNAGVVDTAEPAAQALRTTVGSYAGKRLHLIQFAGPIKAQWVEALVADGLRVVTYIPNNAYLVWGEFAAVSRLQARASDTAKSSVRWEAAWRDEWKVAPSVWADEGLGRGVAEMLSVQLVEDKESNAATLSALRAAGAIYLREPWTMPGYVNFVIQLKPEALGVLTSQPDVVSIHRHVEFIMMDEAQATVLAGRLTGNGPTAGDYLTTLAGWGFTQAQFDASALAVDVSDDGVDNGTTSPNHFVLYRNGDRASTSRLIYRVNQGVSGTDGGIGNSGHGQLNTSIIGGFVPSGSVTVNGNTTSTTAFPHADAQGFRYGLGVAPFVKLGNSTIFDPLYTNPTYATLQSAAYAAGARISSNSWGANVGGYYTPDSQAYDFLVRDAQPGTAGNQAMVIVFAAGNSGPAPSTLGSPGTGKNIICVGAAEGVRSHSLAAGGLSTDGSDRCGITDIGADSWNDLIYFSSRGPCLDGRVKPDIVAGGTHVTGMTFVTVDSTLNGTATATYRASGVCGLMGGGEAGSSADFFPQGQQWWTTSSGTSHSCPAIAGAAALVFQQFLNNPAYLGDHRMPTGANPPSPALVKAYLMNSARYMNGTYANDQLPSNNQGMGHGDLGMAFDGVTRAVRDQNAGDRFSATGQTRTFTGTIPNSGKPFRVTLAWTDVPGPTGANAYVNDLDLIVRVGGISYKGNVFAASGGLSTTAGSADRRNNVESVFLPAGLSGDFTIIVTAANIAGRADPTVSGNNQDYALVVYNSGALTATPTPPVLSTGAIVPVNGGMLRRNDCNTLSIPLANAGDLTATVVSAVLSTSTSGVTISSGISTYPDVAAGAVGVNDTPFQISTSAGIPCQAVASFTLTVQYSGGGAPAVFPFSLVVGNDTSNYAFSASGGANIPTGGTFVPNSNADDVVVSVTAPFSFSVYGTTVAAGGTLRASTNGNLQMVSSGGNLEINNAALPSPVFSASLATLLPYWDDLDLTTTGGGIYTNTVGIAPNRQWFVEWRGRAYLATSTSTIQTINFAILFTEGVSGFKFVYPQIEDSTGANGSSATIGVQAAGAGSFFAQYSYNAPNIASGLVLTIDFPACVFGSGPCGPTPPTITNGPPPSPVIVGTPYSFAYTSTGSPAPTFALTAGTLPPGLTLSSAGLLSGTPTSAGTGLFANLTVTASNGILPNDTQTFSLSVVTRVANYVSSFGLSGSNAQPTADPNGDGVSNLLAYALGVSPITNNAVFDHGTVRNYSGSNYLSIRFSRSSVATDITYIVEASGDLTGAWTELARSSAGGAMTASGGVVVSDSGGPPTYTTEVRDVVALPAAPTNEQRFIRLRVTSP